MDTASSPGDSAATWGHWPPCLQRTVQIEVSEERKEQTETCQGRWLSLHKKPSNPWADDELVGSGAGSTRGSLRGLQSSSCRVSKRCPGRRLPPTWFAQAPWAPVRPAGQPSLGWGACSPGTPPGLAPCPGLLPQHGAQSLRPSPAGALVGTSVHVPQSPLGALKNLP